MAAVKAPPKRKPLSNPRKVKCMCCNEVVDAKELYNTESDLYHSIGKIPYCKPCLMKLFDEYERQFMILSHKNPSRDAMERLCAVTDCYYSDKLFDSAMKDRENENYSKAHLVQLYMKQTNMYQYKSRNYVTTMNERYLEDKASGKIRMVSDKTKSEQDIIKEAMGMFGRGFEEDDYLYLYDQYKDWTARHECNTKTQEELFKRLCFKQLEILKATRIGQDTTKLDSTFQDLLGTAKLQPKQNSGDATADNQTLGTLIDKWENTRPIPEIDEELRDVDKIGLYIDVFFRGHLAKMANIKNAFSSLYDKFMEKYTVRKPEYVGEESNEALFDAVFGSASLDDDIPDYDQDDGGSGVFD